MKKLKFLAMLLMAMTLSLGFTSCSDDDDDDASDIIGTWVIYATDSWTETITFNSNGTFLWTEINEYSGNKYYESGTYKYDKKTLVISFDDEDEPDYYQVVSNSGTSMVLKYISDSSDGDVEVWTRVK